MVFLNKILNNFKGISNIKNRNQTIETIFELLNLSQPKFIEISELNKYKNVYYPIVNPGYLAEDKYNNPFGNELIDLILNRNIKVIIFDTNETHWFDEFKSLNDYLINYNIPQDRIYLFINNPKLYEYKKITNSNINVYCPHVIMIEHSKILQKNQIDYSDNEKKFLFMCHNNKMHEHRIFNLALLHKSNLLGKIDYSCILNLNQDYVFEDYLTRPKLKEKFKTSLDFIVNNYNKKSFFEQSFRARDINSDVIELETFKNSYFNLVTETDFKGYVLHPTEKSLKPFYYFQYPIFVAPQGHVSYLKNTYGFDIFDDIIDHSYDSESDSLTRMLMIHNEIKKIFKNEKFYKKKYKELKNRLINNHKLVRDIVNNSSDVEYIKNTF